MASRRPLLFSSSEDLSASSALSFFSDLSAAQIFPRQTSFFLMTFALSALPSFLRTA